MNIVTEDLGELSASGTRAIEYRDTIYVDERLPESERATVLAVADAHRVRDAKGTPQEKARWERLRRMIAVVAAPTPVDLHQLERRERDPAPRHRPRHQWAVHPLITVT